MSHDTFGAFVGPYKAKGASTGPLAALRLCIKDNIEVAGLPFTAGHTLFADRVGCRTAPAADRLLQAGADLVGMARTDAGGFGMTSPDVCNPRIPSATVGGSSGGCAAAIAGGLADIGLGTDTAGSCRVPAACTGIVGYKPSFGAMPAESVFPLSRSMDHVGLLSRDIDTLAMAVPYVLNTQSDRPTGGNPRDLRIGIDRQSLPFAQRATLARFDAAATFIQAKGHRIVPVALPDRLAVGECLSTIVLSEAADVYRDIDDESRIRLGAAARKALRYEPDAEAVAAARRQRVSFEERYARSFDDCDLLLSPTLYIAPPARGDAALDVDGRRWPLVQVFSAGTAFANVAGLPALSVPFGAAGVGFSLHLSVRRGCDSFLIEAAQRMFGDDVRGSGTAR